MDRSENKMERVLQAIFCLPPQLADEVKTLDEKLLLGCEEIRLRAGQSISVIAEGREKRIGKEIVSAELLRETVSRAARYSVHSYSDTLKYGFIPLRGGNRLGICGTASTIDGRVTGIRTISSLNLRIAHEHKGIADDVMRQCFADGHCKNALVLSPPGFGKTTLLRDMIRKLSYSGIRVGVADERGELAALHNGISQFDIGPTCDVMEGCSKSEAALMLIKTMSPQVIAMDEITSAEDVSAAIYAGYCGVSVIATAHAFDKEDLNRRVVYREIMNAGIFDQLIEIKRNERGRRYRVVQIKEDENA